MLPPEKSEFAMFIAGDRSQAGRLAARRRWAPVRERRRALAELLEELQEARESGADWYVRTVANRNR
jgi:hypothetical protein